MNEPDLSEIRAYANVWSENHAMRKKIAAVREAIAQNADAWFHEDGGTWDCVPVAKIEEALADE
jgi:hypothetical protein